MVSYPKSSQLIHNLINPDPWSSNIIHNGSYRGHGAIHPLQWVWTGRIVVITVRRLRFAASMFWQICTVWYCVGCSPFCQRQESSLYAGVLSRQHKINFCWNSKGIGQDGDDGKPEAKPDRAVKLHCNKEIQNGPSLSSNINCWHYPRTKMTTLLDTACVKWYLFYFNVSLFSS